MEYSAINESREGRPHTKCTAPPPRGIPTPGERPGLPPSHIDRTRHQSAGVCPTVAGKQRSMPRQTRPPGGPSHTCGRGSRCWTETDKLLSHGSQGDKTEASGACQKMNVIGPCRKCAARRILLPRDEPLGDLGEFCRDDRLVPDLVICTMQMRTEQGNT